MFYWTLDHLTQLPLQPANLTTYVSCSLFLADPSIIFDYIVLNLILLLAE
ncbi:hypothetical protein DSUL_20211 [Desulfovibrionales bacterium]